MVACMILLATELLELINVYARLWSQGTLAKFVFVILFVVMIIRIVWAIPTSYKLSIEAKKLERELQNNRIALALSQIRTHFIFNVLNAISGMCKYDPRKADDTIICFARYLRRNIDILSEDKPVKFEEALKHVEDYVELEQVRFGDRIQFVKDIGTDDFLIPSLILQPIVENSIKHGLLPKADGGVITLKTYLEKNYVIVEISDNGIGFDIEELGKKESVGLKNVRFRLLHMVNGTLDIESSQNIGTKVTLRIPL